MAKSRQGWETTIFHGAAGATAATPIVNCQDIELDAPIDYGETTVRGAGVLIPHADRGPVKIDCKITWKHIVRDGDTGLVTLLAAALNTTPTPRAIKYANLVTGTVFDGDCYLKAKDGSPLGGAATYDFEAMPTRDGGREWLLGGV